MREGKNIKSEAKRFIALEGVRGLAAITVVLHHFMLAFYPVLIWGPGSLQHTHFEDNIHGTPLALLFAGTFAVAIFFVLSGFVLTIGFFQTKNESVIKKLAVKRYPRLMLPALTITMICLILIKLGFPHYIAEAAKVTGSGWLAGTSWSSNSSFLDALYSGSIGIFTQGASSFDNVLWTMTTEFLGSFIVFGFVLLFGKSQFRWISYIGVTVITFNTWFLPFILGMALADLYSIGYLGRIKKTRWSVGALAGAAFLGAYPMVGASATLYSFINVPLFTNMKLDYGVLCLTIGAALLIFAVLISKRLTTWLEKPRVSILGKYTFSLYLVHLPILYTTGVMSFLVLNPLIGYNKAALVTFLINVPVVMLATVFFERYVDAPAVRFSSVVAKAFENGKGFGIKKYILNTRRKVRKMQAILLRRQRDVVEESSVE